MFSCDFYLPTFYQLKGEGKMEFWIIMFIFLVMGGTCSLKGTWWDKERKSTEKK